MSDRLEIIPVSTMPSVEGSADVAELLACAFESQALALKERDVIVVCSKVIAKAEDRIIRLCDVTPGAVATQFANDSGKDPRLVEVVLRQARRIVRMARGVLIAQTHHGFVCANAGVDRSNVDGGQSACLLPVDPDASAQRLREVLQKRYSLRLAVIITDSFGRPWRHGQVDVAVGAAGLETIEDCAGQADRYGLTLHDTQPAIADALAAAAGLCFRKQSGVAACVVRNFLYRVAAGCGACDLVRPEDQDLFL